MFDDFSFYDTPCSLFSLSFIIDTAIRSWSKLKCIWYLASSYTFSNYSWLTSTPKSMFSTCFLNNSYFYSICLISTYIFVSFDISNYIIKKFLLWSSNLRKLKLYPDDIACWFCIFRVQNNSSLYLAAIYFIIIYL